MSQDVVLARVQIDAWIAALERDPARDDYAVVRVPLRSTNPFRVERIAIPYAVATARRMRRAIPLGWAANVASAVVVVLATVGLVLSIRSFITAAYLSGPRHEIWIILAVMQVVLWLGLGLRFAADRGLPRRLGPHHVIMPRLPFGSATRVRDADRTAGSAPQQPMPVHTP